MGMVRYGRRPASTRVWYGTTCALVPADPSGEVVVSLHGWPGTDQATSHLDGLVRSQRTGDGLPVDALLATGHTIVYPFLGEPWGSAASTEQAYIDTGEMVTVLGLSAVTPHLIGGSMGGLNAITFAQMDDTLGWPVVLYMPLVSIGEAWDLGGEVRSSVESVWGAGREAVVTNSAAVDPARIDCSFLTGRTLVIAAHNDTLINYATVQAWCQAWELPLVTTGLGHFSMDDPAVVEADLLTHFHP